MDIRRFRFGEFQDEARMTVRLEWRDRERLRALAEREGCSESELLREALGALLDAYAAPLVGRLPTRT